MFPRCGSCLKDSARRPARLARPWRGVAPQLPCEAAISAPPRPAPPRTGTPPARLSPRDATQVASGMRPEEGTLLHPTPPYPTLPHPTLAVRRSGNNPPWRMNANRVTAARRLCWAGRGRAGRTKGCGSETTFMHLYGEIQTPCHLALAGRTLLDRFR